MGLRWMLPPPLLLLLQLVRCASLPAPTNVSISSLNMEHSLSFLPGPDTPSSACFAVEILHLRRRKISWKSVAGCLELTAGQTCNLTRAFGDPLDWYRARVRAFRGNQTSTWTTSGQFQPLSDTVLGPPDVSVSGCGNCLLLRVRPPQSTSVLLLKYFYSDLVFNVRRTRDGAQFGLSLHYKEEVVITYLQPGVEYCITVAVKTVVNSHAVPSEPHCAFTSPPTPPRSLYVVYSLLGAFSALGFLLVGLFVFNNRLNSQKLRRHLNRALSHMNRRSSPPEGPGRILATQFHKDGSSVCLLTSSRPVPSPRRSSEEAEGGCGPDGEMQ